MGFRVTGFSVLKAGFAGGFLLAAILGFGLAPGPGAGAQVEDGGDLRISAKFEKVPIDEAIETLAELAGQAIEVIGAPEGRKVSITLREATLKKSLERVLYPSSFVVEWAEDDRITVRVFEDEFEHPMAKTGNQPPTGPDEFLVTIGDLEEMASAAAQADISGMEAFPPGSSDEISVTVEDLEQMASSSTQGDINRMEAFPPGSPDETPVTVGDLERTASSMAGADRSNMPAFPPGSPGEIPVTIGNLERGASNTARVDMSDMPAFPPGPPDEVPVTVGDLERTASSRVKADVDFVPAFPPAVSP